MFECAVQSAAKPSEDTITVAWLYTVAKRRAVDHWRRTSREENVIQRSARCPAQTSFEVDFEARMAANDLLTGLDHRYQFVLERKYIHGNSVLEIAAQLGISPRATESRLARARRQLRANVCVS